MSKKLIDEITGTDISGESIKSDDIGSLYSELGMIEYNIVRFTAYLENLLEQKSTLIERINSKSPLD